MGKVLSNKCCTIAFYLFSFSLFLLSCGSDGGRFRLEGRFKNLNQGEFYLYNPEMGTKDTIGVKDGRFVYDRVMEDTTMLMLLFPNYSELPVFAQPGVEVKMEGDVSHLKETVVKGTKENEEMTAFRLKSNQLTPPEVEKEAEAYINEHPTSAVSQYLLRRYFILGTKPQYNKAFQLCTVMLNASPDNGRLIRLHKQLERLKAADDMKKLPAFSVKDTQGRTFTNKDMNKDANVIYVWATWSYESQHIGQQLKRKQKEYPARLSVLSICLDASPKEGKHILERDSITWSNVCDGQMWQTPLLGTLGIATLPACIVSDKDGKVLARDLTNADLLKKLDELLKKD